MLPYNPSSTCLQGFVVSGHSNRAWAVVSVWFLQYTHSFVLNILSLCNICCVFNLLCNILNCTYLLYTHLGAFCVIKEIFCMSSKEMSSFRMCSHLSLSSVIIMSDFYWIISYIFWHPFPTNCIIFNMVGKIGRILLLSVKLIFSLLILFLIFAYFKKLHFTPNMFCKYLWVTKLSSIKKSLTNMRPLVNQSLLK